MPVYEYQCSKCGEFEVMQKMSDKPLKACPTCRRKVTKLMSSTSFQLKGSGWYVTDYARKGEADSRKGESGKGDSAKSDSSKSESAKSDSSKSESAKGDSAGADSSKSDSTKSSSDGSSDSSGTKKKGKSKTTPKAAAA